MSVASVPQLLQETRPSPDAIEAALEVLWAYAPESGDPVPRTRLVCERIVRAAYAIDVASLEAENARLLGVVKMLRAAYEQEL